MERWTVVPPPERALAYLLLAVSTSKTGFIRLCAFQDFEAVGLPDSDCFYNPLPKLETKTRALDATRLRNVPQTPGGPPLFEGVVPTQPLFQVH